MILLYREKSFFSTREIDEKTVPIVPTETKPLENQGDPRGASFATTMPKLPMALDSKWTPRVGVGEWGVGKCLKGLVDLEGFEPSTSSMPWKRAPNCATGPRVSFNIARADAGDGAAVVVNKTASPNQAASAGHVADAGGVLSRGDGRPRGLHFPIA